MKRHARTKPSKSSSNGNHLLIDVFEDGNVQVVTHWIGTGSNSEETPELTTNVINAPPLHPTLFDGTFRYDVESVETESEWSLSTESEASQESESEMNLEAVCSRPVFSVPVIEPSSERTESRKQSISVVSKVQGHAVGAVIGSESTVLMQSRGEVRSHSKLMDCMKEVNDMLNDQNSVVILKYPSMEDSQGSKRIQESHRKTAKRMMELTEDVLRRVEGSSRESILGKLQRALGEILYQPEDTIVVHAFSKEDIGKATSAAFVGYFGTECESAVLVQVPEANGKIADAISGSEDEEQMSLDRLRSFLQESLQGQDEILEETLDTEPAITISKSGNTIVGVLSFPNASTAVVKTSVQKFSLGQDHAEMAQSMKDLYRNLVQESSEKLLIQTHSDGDRDSKLKQIKADLDESIRGSQMDSDASGISVRENDDKVLGVLHYSGGSIVIQTCSKNWIKASSSDNPKELLKNIRLLIEQFITNNELEEVDLRSLAGIIVQVFHSPRVDLPEEFTNKHVLQKIPFVVHQLINASVREDALLIINQIREILEDIPKAEIIDPRPEDFDCLDILKSYVDELICEESTQFDDDSILRTLREALLNVLVHYEASLSSALEELLELLKTIPAENIELHSPFRLTSCPGTTDITDEHLRLERFPSDSASIEVVQHIHNLLSDEEPPGGREVSYISMFQTLFLSLLNIIGGWSFRVKSFLDNEPRQTALVEPEPEPEPTAEPSSSLTRKPSVSFHLIQPAEPNEETPSDISQQLEEEQKTLNNTIDELRQFLEKSLNIPDKWDQDRKGSQLEFAEGSPGIKRRMLLLVSQLLDEAGKLKVTDKSRDSIHLRLDTASGELERKENEKYVVLTGNVRDRKHNLGLFFEARMMDLRYSSTVESEVECVKEVRRLSDESDEFDLGGLIPEMVESCMAEVGSDLGDADDDNAQTGGEEFRIQESLSRYFELIQNYIQESMEPMRETLGVILERLATMGTEKIREIRSSFIQTSSNFGDEYTVEMIEDSHQEEVVLEEVEELTQEAKSVQCVVSVANQSVQNYEDLKIDSTRLDGIEHELKDLKQQLKDLCGILRPPVAPMEPPLVDSIERSQSESTKSSSETMSLLTIVEPSAPTLEEIEGRLSLTLEIVSDTAPSQLSDLSDVCEDFFSAMECFAEVVPEDDEKLSGKSDVLRRSSESVPEKPTMEPSRRSTIDSIRVSRDKSTLLEDTEVVIAETRLALTTDIDRSSEVVIETQSDPSGVGEKRDKRVLSFADVVIEQSPRRSTVGVSEVHDKRDSRVLSIEEAVVEQLQRLSTDGSSDVDDKRDRRELSVEEPVVEQPQRRETVDPTEIADEVEVAAEIMTSRKSLEQQLPLTRSSEIVIKQRRKSTVDSTEIADGTVGERVSSIEEPPEDVPYRESLDDRPSLTMERARPSNAGTEEIQLEDKRRSTVDSTVTANEQRDSRVPSIVEPTESTETHRTSTLSERRETISSLVQTSPQASFERRETISSLAQTSPQGSLEEVDQSRRSTIVSTRDSTTSKSISEEQRKPSRKRSLESGEIPVQDGEKFKQGAVCDLMLSYQCPMADEIGRQFTCPAEIYSCHPVGSNQLIVHWDVAPQFLRQISGYKIYVDGEARSICYSRRRRTTLIEDINLQHQHRIAIYCTPEASVREIVQWAPGIFFYHL